MDDYTKEQIELYAQMEVSTLVKQAIENNSNQPISFIAKQAYETAYGKIAEELQSDARSREELQRLGIEIANNVISALKRYIENLEPTEPRAYTAEDLTRPLSVKTATENPGYAKALLEAIESIHPEMRIYYTFPYLLDYTPLELGRLFSVDQERPSIVASMTIMVTPPDNVLKKKASKHIDQIDREIFDNFKKRLNISISYEDFLLKRDISQAAAQANMLYDCLNELQSKGKITAEQHIKGKKIWQEPFALADITCLQPSAVGSAVAEDPASIPKITAIANKNLASYLIKCDRTMSAKIKNIQGASADDNFKGPAGAELM